MDKTLEYLLREFRERIDALSNAAARGNCGDYVEYKYVCGQIRGLDAACAVIEDLNKRMEISDD